MPIFLKAARVLLAIALLYSLFTIHYSLEPAGASHCPGTDYDCQIQEIQREIDGIKPAHEQNKQELASLTKQVKDIQSRIDGISVRLNKLEKDILAREEDLVFREELFNQKSKELYITLRQNDPIAPFFFADSATELLRQLSARSRALTEDQKAIEDLANQIATLKSDRETLTSSRVSLKQLQAQLDGKADFLAGEVEKVETYIQSLSAKQQQLLALKAGGFQTSVGDTPPTLEPCSGPPGSENYCNPGTASFAAFSFGAPHRKGMSQFGAKGRADAGAGVEDILNAYYGNVKIDTRGDLPGSINTSAGTLPFEDNYMMGIAEMPSSWNINALKAQAIAARTYAASYVGWRNSNPAGATGSICTTEACQVYRSSKAASPPDAWRRAVSETRGQIMISNNTSEIISAWYASTAGGYTFSYTTLGHSTPGGWDADGGRGGWPDQAWDKRAGSPWFYKGWYKKRSGDSCGRSHPWLTTQEMADILNAWHVLYKGGGDVSRISPTDTGCWPGNPYTVGELAAIGGFTSVSSASVVYGDSGSTLQVTFGTNQGSVTVSGEEFKKAFNLRAPGFIGIKSSLFNIVGAN